MTSNKSECNRRIITRKKSFIIAIIIYSIVVFITNWPILLHTDIMKWDIWNVEYPLQVMASDALHEGKFPIWNSLINYGTPYYAFTGSPVWYPITLLLDLVGYNMYTPAIEYCIHVVIGSYGMYLLALRKNREDKENDYIDKSDFAVSLGLGFIYGFSGVFLSNAQHIMIIISAAWIPYCLYYAERFVNYKKKRDLLIFGLLAAFILTGGYPEIFYDLFIVMVPYVIFINIREIHITHEIKRTAKLVLRSLLQLVSFGAVSIVASAISLVPFLCFMPNLSRSNGLSESDIVSPPLSTLVSMILPFGTELNTGFEVSMGCFYIGIITIIIIPFVLIKKGGKYFYFFMFLITLFLCFGNRSFLYSLLHEYAPLYSSFRFSSLFRPFCCLFALLFVKDFLMEVVKEDSKYGNIFEKIIFVLCIYLVIEFIFLVINKSSFEKYLFDYNSVLGAVSAYILATILCITILIVFKYRNINIEKNIMLVIMIIIEVFLIQGESFSVTIAQYNYLDYFKDSSVKDAIKSCESEYANRTQIISSDNIRRNSYSSLNNIAFSKTPGDNVDLSLQLKYISEYKNTYNRSINQQTAEVFFSNDIVTDKQMNLSTWSGLSGVDPCEIHISETPPEFSGGESVKISNFYNVVKERRCDFCYDSGGIEINELIGASQMDATKIRIYLSNSYCKKDIRLTTEFVDVNDINYNYQDYYSITKIDGENYVDISLPNTNSQYKKIRVVCSDKIATATIVQLERQERDNYSEITSYGYNNMCISVDAPTDGVVTLLQANYNGWNVYVDGKKANIVEVDGCFLGVGVTKGKHTIEFSFCPKDFYFGLIISVVYIIFLIVILLYDRRKTVKQTSYEKSTMN